MEIVLLSIFSTLSCLAAAIGTKTEFYQASNERRIVNEYIIVLREESVKAVITKQQFSPNLAVKSVANKVVNSVGGRGDSPLQ